MLLDRDVERRGHGLTIGRVVDAGLRVCGHQVVQLAGELAEGLLFGRLVLVKSLLALISGVLVEVPVQLRILRS